MAKYKFLYLDDENDETTAAIADGLQIDGLIDVTYEQPKTFGDEIKDLKARLKDFDGLILDLRLDGKALDIAYNAPSIAQELRMIAAEGGVKSCPIILCSTDEKMRATYDVEKICHEHFDYKFTKQVSPPWKKFAIKLSSLAKGYQFISDSNYNMPVILGRENLSALDTRVLEHFTDLAKPLPTYDYASFVIKELFHQPGALIKEKLLAARLGIDIDKSSDWQNLSEDFFSNALFSGVFSDGWKRWWMDIVQNIFKETTKGKRLTILNATERVKLLSEISGYKNLVAALPMEYNKSSNFWTICEFFKYPIDPLEGFKIHTTIEPKAWQDERYVSLKAVLEKRYPRPHSSESNRIKLIKEELSSK